ncbi:MAG: nucleotidyl transferase AbiEii/AbiGii toxin family protein [Coriobacteriia bacterium]|nr:nucleotidyl transferase AbiEii/AbiGii toxin family protein [Coriobacteriia bacterium]
MAELIKQMLEDSKGEGIGIRERFREVTQRIVLAGLSRSGFNKVAAMYGGTCLRLFHGSVRYSEDLDFSLLEPSLDRDFSLGDYLPAINDELRASGITTELTLKQKTADTDIQTATAICSIELPEYGLNSKQAVKVKIDVDTKPPLGFTTENRLLLLPFSFMVRCYQLPCLYAGKLHALLYRRWLSRVKGRDWYDFEWFVRNSISLDLVHLSSRIKKLSPSEPALDTPEAVRAALIDKALSTDIDAMKRDLQPFLPDLSVLEIWSSEYFVQLVELMRFQ